ncbi:MAG: LysR family transcriptional regulator [Oscillospiraceae bacterium]|nr:LysR family transcriptional regulator [Oscillospiraceae bacterium]
MDIQVLRNFLLVAKERNITRAAEILHIAQPTLSRQMQNLEEEYGKQLLYRENKTIRLTEQGRILQQRADEIIYLFEKSRSEINPVPDTVSGEIRISLCEVAAVDSIYALAKQFQDENPLTVFRFFNTSSETSSGLITDGIADMGLLFGYADGSRLNSHRLRREESRAVLMRQDHPLAAKEEISMEDLKGWPLVVYQDAVRGVPSIIEYGLTADDMKATFTTTFSAVKMVEQGIGIATIIDGTVDSSIVTSSTNLVTRPMNDAPSIPTFLAWKRNGTLSHQASLFLDLLTANI